MMYAYVSTARDFSWNNQGIEKKNMWYKSPHFIAFHGLLSSDKSEHWATKVTFSYLILTLLQIIYVILRLLVNGLLLWFCLWTRDFEERKKSVVSEDWGSICHQWEPLTRWEKAIAVSVKELVLLLHNANELYMGYKASYLSLQGEWLSQRCRQTAYKEKGVEMEMEFAVSYLELY